MSGRPLLSRLSRIAEDIPPYLGMLGVLITPEIRAVVRRDWRTALIPLRGSYLSPGLHRRARIRLMRHHYSFIRRHLAGDCLARICRGPLAVWEEPRNGTVYRIVLALPPSIKEQAEGDICLVFKADATDVFTLAFTICPGRSFGLAGDVLYIGRLQGARQQMDLIRDSAKKCNGISQQTLLLAAAEGICLAMGIRWMVCPSSRAQLSVGRQDEFSSGVSIYDQFWLDIGATRLGEENFHLPVPMPHKPTSQIKRCHRSRAAGRRRYRDSVSDQARKIFRELFIDGKR